MNDECRNPNDERSPNVECPNGVRHSAAFASVLRGLLAVLVLAAGCTRDEPRGDGTTTADEQRTLARAAGWLWAQQSEDGGWHSQTYGLLKSGQALTPFVLHALLDVPEDVAARPP